MAIAKQVSWQGTWSSHPNEWWFFLRIKHCFFGLFRGADRYTSLENSLIFGKEFLLCNILTYRACQDLGMDPRIFESLSMKKKRLAACLWVFPPNVLKSSIWEKLPWPSTVLVQSHSLCRFSLLVFHSQKTKLAQFRSSDHFSLGKKHERNCDKLPIAYV